MRSIQRHTIELSPSSGTKIPRKVLSLALLQGLQVEHNDWGRQKDVTDTKVSKQYVEHQVQRCWVTPSQPSEAYGLEETKMKR